MEIFDERGTKIGEWTSREIHSPESLVAPLSKERFSNDLIKIMDDIRSKISKFPVIELTDIHIYDRNLRRKGYGKLAMLEFLRHGKNSGYAQAIVKIGKRETRDSLEGNTTFYEKLGWKRFVTPDEVFSLRFAYFDLAGFQPA